MSVSPPGLFPDSRVQAQGNRATKRSPSEAEPPLVTQRSFIWRWETLFSAGNQACRAYSRLCSPSLTSHLSGAPLIYHGHPTHAGASQHITCSQAAEHRRAFLILANELVYSGILRETGNTFEVFLVLFETNSNSVSWGGWWGTASPLARQAGNVRTEYPSD